MSEEQLKAFLEKVKADTSLQDKLKAAADSDAVLAIAKDAGFVISTEDLKSIQSEISEEELEGAAGGVNPNIMICIANPVVSVITAAACFWLKLINKAPALTGVFYCFNHPKKTINQPSIPGTIERSNYQQKTLQDIIAITVKDYR